MTTPSLPQLQLSDDALTRLGGTASEVVDDLEAQHSDFFADIEVWWKWYEAQPAVARKRTPWDGASNIVMPVIRTASDAVIAQQYATIHSHGKIWTGRTLNEDFSDFVTPVVDFLNWGANGNEFSLKRPTLDWITELDVLGSGILMLGWEDRQRWLMLPGAGKPVRAVVKRGPVVHAVPRERCIWEPGRDIQDSEVVAVQSFQSYTEMVRMAQQKLWDEEVVEGARGRGEANSPGARIAKDRSARAGQSLTSVRTELAAHDVRTLWLDWPMLEAMDVRPGKQDVDDPSASNIVVVLHRKTRKVLRAMFDPFGLGRRPLYEAYFKKRAGDATGVGMAKMLEMHQRAISTMANQAIDAVTLANSINMKTTDSSILKDGFTPNRPIQLTNINDAEVMQLSKQVFPDIQLMNLVQVYAERVSGVSDPLIGRESRSGGHPSPATNFLGQLEQGKVLQSPVMLSIREAMSHLGEDIATLYQLRAVPGDGKLQRVLGPQDGAKVQQWMFPTDQTIIGNLSMDIFAMDEQHNPEARQRQAVVTAQMTNNFWGTVLPMIQAIESGKIGPKMAEGLRSAMLGNIKSFKSFLEASDEDDLEAYLGALDESRQQSVNGLGEAERLLQRGDLLTGAGGGAGNGAVPVGAVGGAGAGAGGGAGGGGQPFALQ